MTKISPTQFIPSMNSVTEFASNHNVIVPVAIAGLAEMGLRYTAPKPLKGKAQAQPEQTSTLGKMGRAFLTLVRNFAIAAGITTGLYEGAKAGIAGAAALTAASAKLPDGTLLNQLKLAKAKYPALKRDADLFASIGVGMLTKLARSKIGL